MESDSILVVGGRVQVRSDGSREVVADRITRIDEVLGTWVKDVYLPMDLEVAGQAGVAALGGPVRPVRRPCAAAAPGGRGTPPPDEPAAEAAAGAGGPGLLRRHRWARAARPTPAR